MRRASATSDWSDDGAARLAAALAHYTLLSIAPLVVLAVAIAGLAFGDDAARGQIAQQIGTVVGAQAAESARSSAWSCCCSARPAGSASCSRH